MDCTVLFQCHTSVVLRLTESEGVLPSAASAAAAKKSMPDVSSEFALDRNTPFTV